MCDETSVRAAWNQQENRSVPVSSVFVSSFQPARHWLPPHPLFYSVLPSLLAHHPLLFLFPLGLPFLLIVNLLSPRVPASFSIPNSSLPYFFSAPPPSPLVSAVSPALRQAWTFNSLLWPHGQHWLGIVGP